MQILPELLVTLAVAFTVNLPLGFWRAGLRKFSWQWFLATHLSIPFVIAVRMALHLPLGYVPLVVAAAIGGQVLGSMAQRRCRCPVMRHKNYGNAKSIYPRGLQYRTRGN